MLSATAGSGDGFTKDNDGLGDRERAGVDVENVANASEIKVSRLFEGMAEYNSEDLGICGVQPPDYQVEKIPSRCN